MLKCRAIILPDPCADSQVCMFESLEPSQMQYQVNPQVEQSFGVSGINPTISSRSQNTGCSRLCFPYVNKTAFYGVIYC